MVGEGVAVADAGRAEQQRVDEVHVGRAADHRRLAGVQEERGRRVRQERGPLRQGLALVLLSHQVEADHLRARTRQRRSHHAGRHGGISC